MRTREWGRERESVRRKRDFKRTERGKWEEERDGEKENERERERERKKERKRERQKDRMR